MNGFIWNKSVLLINFHDVSAVAYEVYTWLSQHSDLIINTRIYNIFQSLVTLCVTV